ncbi:hypothetical protein A2Z67_00970 [Candidatus Woesebacteria bacterium RBG_13_36_22]|uniref:DUF5658 domain-containing protein n=1 Tax=Candidatus Woesebacteria bacterium RBG_13_36_22 TaxID=1802478 RepID=A0A1F7WZT9_9BACT|nr:MAG: hypothetical protein A2Z67_00970 [Candidatus Woesebacteria bacterium RBG_13_36_22]
MKTGLIVGILILLFNIFDAIITFALVHKNGISIESNKLIVYLYSYVGNWVFIIKIAYVLATCISIFLFWKSKIVRTAGYFVLSLYTGLMIYLMLILLGGF